MQEVSADAAMQEIAHVARRLVLFSSSMHTCGSSSYASFIIDFSLIFVSS